MVSDFGRQNEQMREMVRRFDEILSEKASKASLNEAENAMANNYVKLRYWEALETEIKN